MQEISELERRISAALQRISYSVERVTADSAAAYAAVAQAEAQMIAQEEAMLQLAANAALSAPPEQAAPEVLLQIEPEAVLEAQPVLEAQSLDFDGAAADDAAVQGAEAEALIAQQLIAEEAAGALVRMQQELAAAEDRELMMTREYEEQVSRLTQQLDVQGLELQRMRKTAIGLREELRALREASEAGLVDADMVNRAALAELDALRATRLAELAELDELSAALDEHLTEAENA